MRDVLIEKMISGNGRRKSLQFTEIIEKDGYMARAQKKYSYFVSEKIGKFLGNKSLKEWSEVKSKELLQKPRHVSVKRVFDKENSIGLTCCRTTGSFYIVRHEKVFAVAFLHSVTFDILGRLTP